MTLRAQGFLGTEGRRGGVPGMLRRIGAVQLDTISVLARSHELVAYARLGPVPRDRIERAYWHPGAPTAFEYWSHAACVLPIEEWPYYAFRRRAIRSRGLRWHTVPERACAEVVARLRGEGPLTATQLGGAKGGGPWWDWSETKIAVEWLLDVGDVICVRREGWRRVYDLPERDGGARVGRPRRPRPGPGRPAGQAPGRAAVPVRLAGLGPQANAADVRLRAFPRGVRAQAQADSRLLRHAAAGRRAAGRPGGPGAPREDPGGPAALPGRRGRGRADGPGTARGRRVGRLHVGGAGPGQPAPPRRAPGGRPRLTRHRPARAFARCRRA